MLHPTGPFSSPCTSQTLRGPSPCSKASHQLSPSSRTTSKICRHSVMNTWRLKASTGRWEQFGRSCSTAQGTSCNGVASTCTDTLKGGSVHTAGGGLMTKLHCRFRGLYRIQPAKPVHGAATHPEWSECLARVSPRHANGLSRIQSAKPRHRAAMDPQCSQSHARVLAEPGTPLVTNPTNMVAFPSRFSKTRSLQRVGSHSHNGGSHVHGHDEDESCACSKKHEYATAKHAEGEGVGGRAQSHNHAHANHHDNEPESHSHGRHGHADHDGHKHDNHVGTQAEHHHDHSSKSSHKDHNHDSQQDPHHHDSHNNCCHGAHGHGHSHSHADPKDYNILQKAIAAVANLTRITALANLLRESLPAACISMGLCLLAAAVPAVLGPVAGRGAQSLFLAVAFPLTGVPALLDSAIDVAGGSVNIHVLMALAAFASFFMGNALEGALLLAMFTLSHRAEEYFTERALRDLNSLRENSPVTALVVEPFDSLAPPPMSAMKYTEVPVAEVLVGDLILVRAGETVAVDGEVSQGRSMITVEHLTGESQPLAKAVGDQVPGGARTVDGMLIVQVKKAWDDSTVARIVRLTEDARARRPRLQRWLDLFSERYSQAVFAASIAVAALGPLFGLPFFSTADGLRGSLYRALGLMVAASPCALAVAPLAYAAAVSSCASQGILLRGGQALDALAECDTLAFDKTGTLTTGELLCRSIDPIHGHDLSDPSRSSLYVQCCSPNCADEALAVAAAMERAASHPIARAVLEHSEGKTLPAVEVQDFESIPGRGVKALVTTLSGCTVEEGESCPQRARLGSLDYITAESAADSRASISEAASAASSDIDLIQAALSIGQKITLFHFEDRLRPHTAQVVSALREGAGLRVLMLTGDRVESAQRVAAAVGIHEFYAALKPEDKLNYVQLLTRSDGKGGLVMVGDGINDAPALAAATVGIVLASRASATAAAAADVLLLRDALDGVPFLVAKARQTTAVVQQSVALALIAIVIGVFPVLTGSLPLWLTVLLHEGGTLLVCLNSLRVFNNPAQASPARTLQEKVATVGRHLSKMTPSFIKEEPLGGATKLT